MEWKLDDNRPIWIQLQEQLTRKILSGWYRAGERLPSVRELAATAAEGGADAGGRCESQYDAAGAGGAGYGGTDRDEPDYRKDGNGRQCRAGRYESHIGGRHYTAFL